MSKLNIIAQIRFEFKLGYFKGNIEKMMDYTRNKINLIKNNELKINFTSQLKDMLDNIQELNQKTDNFEKIKYKGVEKKDTVEVINKYKLINKQYEVLEKSIEKERSDQKK